MSVKIRDCFYSGLMNHDRQSTHVTLIAISKRLTIMRLRNSVYFTIIEDILTHFSDVEYQSGNKTEVLFLEINEVIKMVRLVDQTNG